MLKTVAGPSQRKQHETQGNNAIWGTNIISSAKYFVEWLLNQEWQKGQRHAECMGERKKLHKCKLKRNWEALA